MPSQEEQELLARIGQLAVKTAWVLIWWQTGKINLHKAQQAGVQSVPSTQASYSRNNTHRHGGFPHKHRVEPYPSTRGPSGFRHRSLVLNNGGTQTPPSDSPTPEASGPANSSGAWISKNTRGQRSLINSAVYEKNNEAHVKAIEASRQQKNRQQDVREQSQLANHFHRYGGQARVPPTPTNPTATGNHEVEIHGIRFRVAHSGSKLIKVSEYTHNLLGDLHPVSATPKVAFVGGVKFHRSKTGNLYRAGVLKAQRVMRQGTGLSIHSRCFKSGRLPGAVAQGNCANGESCDLSHDLTPQRTPTCVHFIKGNCANPNCPYAHSSVSPGALVCRSFGMYGYCDKGDECEERHVFECPDFSNTGKCKNKGCKLLHRERASVLRKRTDEDESEDLSSDDEPVDSDDVDSDEVEEFITDGAGDDTDFKVQKDFISF
ncbi:zinc finger MIZ domain-containing protein 2 [Colletotrichum spaethianum]|uniref:Zinc finger MIZ domain-containing protein 2 n=1 Tax=Colletotrichum spaethianum TaxID=700344 RepID=A0AA37P4T5_9PEZI|nr:zinc finger MIZ domain-containing protein 2 [Colletotrichum spaethianum]GKT42006.1 zinc finger MIZ domain-containing protein 2 [Colletotrichum spaethianum]